MHSITQARGACWFVIGNVCKRSANAYLRLPSWVEIAMSAQHRRRADVAATHAVLQQTVHSQGRGEGWRKQAAPQHGKIKTTIRKIDTLRHIMIASAHKRQPGSLGKKSTSSIQKAHAHARPTQAAVHPTSTAGIGVRCPRSTTAPSTQSICCSFLPAEYASPKIDHQFLEVTSPTLA